MTKAELAAFDEEIRRRAYSETVGLSEWLAARGVFVGKSGVHLYVARLRKSDEQKLIAPSINSATRAAILAFRAAFATLNAELLKLENIEVNE
ncbi:MAG: hypothetical protein RKO66_14310 [Candidatus Contendobacter sp.]|nr:hypothetical protein [Candidatus Contendobacter sp.]MDS4031226.1 hypothetical protein [Candidatus Contendobacter sp.]